MNFRGEFSVYRAIKSKSRIVFLGIGLILIADCSSIYRMGQFQAEGSFEQNHDVSGPLDLEVRSGSGAIRVYGADTDQIEITARFQVWARSPERADKRVAELENNPPIEVSGNRVVIGLSDGRGLLDNVAISYEIWVPAETTVRAQTGSGRIEISDLIGDVDVQTGSERLVLGEISGAVQAQTGSGGIQADAIAGSFDGRTGSGGVSLSQTESGRVDVTTGSGGITLSGIKGPLNVRAGSGRIRVEGDPVDSWTLNTGSGGVTIVLPSTASFDLDADAGSGNVNVEEPLDFDGTTDRDRRRMRGSVGDGGPNVGVRTGSGSIRIGTSG